MLEQDGHIAENILAEYAENPGAIRGREVVEAHLQQCAACWTIVDDYRSMASAMRDEETWWVASELIEGKGARLIRDFKARRAAEDSEAEQLLGHVLETQYRFVKANIIRKARYHTGGVVRLLCQTAYDECVRTPRYAIMLAETACLIAEALPDDYYPCGAVNELRGRAWKENSTACRYLGRFNEGFDALLRAERAYRRLLDPEMHLASLDLARALLLWEQQRYDEALPFARTAAERFALRRETQHYSEAKEAEALILHRLGDLSAAIATYMAVYEMADDLGDAEMKARAAKNLGIASRDRGDIGSASKFLLTALQIYDGLNQQAMVVNTRWSIACLLLSAGNARDAAHRLEPIVSELEALGMKADAARARLDLAEALLILRRYDDVYFVCEDLVAYFRLAKMLTGALTAAAFLKEAAANRTITREHIQHVRVYLAAIEKAPDLPFAPPLTIN